MKYERLNKMKYELESIKSDFVSIHIDDYNGLLNILEEDTTCIDTEDEVELDTDQLRNLVYKCLKLHEGDKEGGSF